jgi:hypothetical protein
MPLHVPLDAKQWTEVERQAIRVFTKSFTPAWKLPPRQFSDWHDMALSRLDDPDVYYYDKPVVLLMNGKNFSATDIFLAGLKGIRNARSSAARARAGVRTRRRLPPARRRCAFASVQWRRSKRTEDYLTVMA